MPVNIGHGGVVGWRDGGPQQGKDFVIVFLSNLQVGKCSLQDLCTDTQSWTGMKMTQHRNYGGILLIFKLRNPHASKLKFKRRKQSQIFSLWYNWIAIFLLLSPFKSTSIEIHHESWATSSATYMDTYMVKHCSSHCRRFLLYLMKLLLRTKEQSHYSSLLRSYTSS